MPTVEEIARRTRNYNNAKDITSDAQKAKISGTSYGKFKAGIAQYDEETGYNVNAMDYLKKKDSSNAPIKKGIAFIK